MKITANIPNTPQPYSSDELDFFLNMEETIDTEYIRTNMMIASQIEDAMESKKIGKKQLADLLGKKPSVITKWLTGTHNFEVKTLTEIAKVLDITFFAFDVCKQEGKIILEAHVTLNLTIDKPVSIPNLKGKIYQEYASLSNGTHSSDNLPHSYNYFNKTHQAEA